MKYRGFSSLYAYCAHRSHSTQGKDKTTCPSLSFNFNNIISPNNADVATKMRYANAIKFASSTNKSIAGRVATYRC